MECGISLGAGLGVEADVAEEARELGPHMRRFLAPDLLARELTLFGAALQRGSKLGDELGREEPLAKLLDRFILGRLQDPAENRLDVAPLRKRSCAV